MTDDVNPVAPTAPAAPADLTDADIAWLADWAKWLVGYSPLVHQRPAQTVLALLAERERLVARVAELESELSRLKAFERARWEGAVQAFGVPRPTLEVDAGLVSRFANDDREERVGYVGPATRREDKADD